MSAELKELSSRGGAISASSFGGVREAHASRADSPPCGAAAPDGAAPKEFREQRSSHSPTKTSRLREPDGREEGLAEKGRGSTSERPPQAPRKRNLPKEGFAELQRIWSARPWPDTPKDIAAAERAYLLAAAEVGNNVILTGARATVEAPAYRGEKARFLKPLGKWLLARGWEKPPPQPAPSRPRQQHACRKPKPDLARMMLELGRRA